MDSISIFEVRHAQESDIESIMEITREGFSKYSEMTGVTSLDALKETYDDVRRDIETKSCLLHFPTVSL